MPKKYIEYPCEYCKKLCKRTNIRALCSLECRLLGNIKKKNGCWLWQGKKTSWGYGEIMLKGKRYRAHRVSFEYFNGESDPSKVICHTCDIQKCINPKHLFQGTNKENSIDMVNKDRALTGNRNMMNRPKEVIKIRTELSRIINKERR